ncbi:TPA: peptidoglycan DD-metalloendopeptidase family protein [Bacillus cereus]|nr:peptidoglycan DD-metalloendopeptidase family protein [Bacillus cereus]
MDMEQEDLEEKEAEKKAKKSRKRKLWIVGGFLFSSFSLILIGCIVVGLVLFMVLDGEKKEPVSGGGPLTGNTICRPGDKQLTAADLDPHLGGVFTSKGQAFIDAGTQNNIDPVLLTAIALLETGNGSSNAVKKYNNPGGLMNPASTNMTGFIQFGTLEEGINGMARNLYKNYIGMGITTIEAIGAKYAPPGAANDPHGTNGLWPTLVTKFAQQLGGLTFNCTPADSGSVGSVGDPSSSGFVLPIPGNPIVTSPYGPRWGTIHKGIDYGCTRGQTPIGAAKAGRVGLAQFGAGGSGFGGYGNLVVLEHEGGLWTLYGHMDALSVQQGQMVQAGQQLGVCGATGQVTGPHLHFEIKTAFMYGQVDPAPYMPK